MSLYIDPLNNNSVLEFGDYNTSYISQDYSDIHYYKLQSLTNWTINLKNAYINKTFSFMSTNPAMATISTGF